MGILSQNLLRVSTLLFASDMEETIHKTPKLLPKELGLWSFPISVINLTTTVTNPSPNLSAQNNNNYDYYYLKIFLLIFSISILILLFNGYYMHFITSLY